MEKRREIIGWETKHFRSFYLRSGESWCKVYQKKNTRELVTTSGLELLVVKLFEKKLLVVKFEQ